MFIFLSPVIWKKNLEWWFFFPLPLPLWQNLEKVKPLKAWVNYKGDIQWKQIAKGFDPDKCREYLDLFSLQ